MMNALVLMGIKHCGKSTQGKRLAQHFGCPFYDTDDVIKEITGLVPRELYSSQGEGAFLEAETAACKKLASMLKTAPGVCASSKSPDVCSSNKSAVAGAQSGFSAVIATGGGICNNSEALEVLRGIGFFVFLHAPENVAADRIAREVTVADDGTLSGVPAYIAKKNPQSIDDVRTIFHEFYVERTAQYKRIAHVDVDMMPVSKDENMMRIIEAIKNV